MPQTFAHGGTTKAHRLKKSTLSYGDCMSNSSHKENDYLINVTFIHFIPVIHVENPRYLSPVACTPRQVHSCMTSNSDMCEVDLDMQMSFLNTALFTLLHWRIFYPSYCRLTRMRASSSSNHYVQLPSEYLEGEIALNRVMVTNETSCP